MEGILRVNIVVSTSRTSNWMNYNLPHQRPSRSDMTISGCKGYLPQSLISFTGCPFFFFFFNDGFLGDSNVLYFVGGLGTQVC